MSSMLPVLLRSQQHGQRAMRSAAVRTTSRAMINRGISAQVRPGLGQVSLLIAAHHPDQRLQQHQQQQRYETTQYRFLSTTGGNDDEESPTPPKAETPTAKDTSKEEPPKPKEKQNVEQLEYQAETKQLLDIVTNSLYTDKDVFLRELVSNASDSLEKLRHLQATDVHTIDPDVPLEIRIETDEVKSSITITDTGIGMTREDMIENLGTIARSGSKKFMSELKLQQDSASTGVDVSKGIIGKFGVGFYSAFMVGDQVDVRSKSALVDNSELIPKVWSSDNGAGSFEISDLDDNVRQERGSTVEIFLKEDFWDYCDENKLEEILKKYSNFVNFPIFLNGKRVNTIDAVWVKDPKEVDDETYTNFYKYISNNIDDPFDKIHFRADAPLDVKALFFIPSFHSEKYGMGRMEPGVSLYSRKVLIESKSPDILPDWMRFVKGVVDSEDLPLAISREKAQDSALITKLRSVLVRKFIAHITKLAKRDRSRFVDEFYKEYSFFLKEGICQDPDTQTTLLLSRLLYFETSKNINTELTSLDEYIARMRPEQKDIYYLCAPTRDAAVNSPYLEAFEKADVEVLFLYTAIEDFVMANLMTYEGRNLVSSEKSDIDLSDLTKSSQDSDDDEDKDDSKNPYKADRTLTDKEALDLCLWLKKELGDKKISSCTVTTRLNSSPAIVTDHESGALRRMMRLVDTQDGNRDSIPLPKQHVEINPSHPVIVGIHDVMKKEPTLARVLAEQVYDNCLIAAGLLDDGRSMLPRLNDILVCVVNGAKGEGTTMEAKETASNASHSTKTMEDKPAPLNEPEVAEDSKNTKKV